MNEPTLGTLPKPCDAYHEKNPRYRITAGLFYPAVLGNIAWNFVSSASDRVVHAGSWDGLSAWDEHGKAYANLCLLAVILLGFVLDFRNFTNPEPKKRPARTLNWSGFGLKSLALILITISSHLLEGGAKVDAEYSVLQTGWAAALVGAALVLLNLLVCTSRDDWQRGRRQGKRFKVLFGFSFLIGASMIAGGVALSCGRLTSPGGLLIGTVGLLALAAVRMKIIAGLPRFAGQ